MNKRTRLRPPPAVIALSALAVGAVAVAVVVVGSPPATASPGRTVTVTRGVVQSTVSGSGNLAPANQLELNFGTGGKVTKIYVKAGEHVSQGQLLARIDDSSAKVAVAQAQADLATAQDTLASAAVGTTAAASAAAAVDSAELTLKSAEQALTDTELRAPAPATVASIAGSVGETVGSSSSASSSSSATPSSTSGTTDAASSASTDSASTATSGSAGFITLAQLSRFKLDVSVSEADIGKVKVGQPATVTVDAVPGLKLSGHVAALGVLSSAASTTSSSTAVAYPVTIVLDQASKTARAGMSASADIVVAQVSGLTVPTQAVTRSSVTLVQNGEHVTTPVQTGVAGDSTTQIVSGVKAGDAVYVESPSAAAGAAATGSSSTNAQQNGRTGLGGGGFGGGGGGFGGGRPPGAGAAAGGR